MHRKNIIKRLFAFTILTIILPLFSEITKQRVVADPIHIPERIVSTPNEQSHNAMRINWHVMTTEQITQQITYTPFADVTYAHGQTVEATTNIWTLPNEEFPQFTYEPRLIAEGVIENLQPNTKYRYRVGNENYWSDDYFFTTASENKNDEFSFILFADPQSTVHTNMYNTLSSSKMFYDTPAFYVINGDLVEVGGKENEFASFFSKGETFLKDAPMATIPGNHETLIANLSDPNKVIYKENLGEARAYNAHFNNPKNGPIFNGGEDALNSSYYFYYNRVLFVMINTQQTDANLRLTAQWMKDLLDYDALHNLSDYKFASMHKGVFGNYYFGNGAIAQMNAIFMPVFDAYQFDLVTSGHDHTYVRTHPVYNNRVVAPHEGTIYTIVGTTGPKFNTAKPGALDQPQFAVAIEKQKMGIYSHITVSKTGLNVEVRDDRNELIDAYTVLPRQSAQLARTINVEATAHAGSVTLNLDVANRYHLTSLVLETQQEKVLDEIPLNAISYTSATLTPDSVHNLQIRATYSDGSEYLKRFTVTTGTFIAFADNSITVANRENFVFDEYEVYVNNKHVETMRKGFAYRLLDYPTGQYLIRVNLLNNREIVDYDYYYLAI